MALSRPFKEDCRALLLSTPLSCPPGDYGVMSLALFPIGSVSNSSILQIFRDASDLRWLLFPPVYLLGHFPSLWHVQGSTPTAVTLASVTGVTIVVTNTFAVYYRCYYRGYKHVCCLLQVLLSWLQLRLMSVIGVTIVATSTPAVCYRCYCCCCKHACCLLQVLLCGYKHAYCLLQVLL